LPGRKPSGLTAANGYGSRGRMPRRGRRAHRNPLPFYFRQDPCTRGTAVGRAEAGLGHPRAAGTHDGGSPTDASPSQPDTKKCLQVGRETYAITSQPGTSYTFDTRIDTATCGARVGRETIALTPIGTLQVQRPQPVPNPAEHTNQETHRRKSTKPQKPHRHRHRQYETQGLAINTFSSASRS